MECPARHLQDSTSQERGFLDMRARAMSCTAGSVLPARGRRLGAVLSLRSAAAPAWPLRLAAASFSGRGDKAWVMRMTCAVSRGLGDRNDLQRRVAFKADATVSSGGLAIDSDPWRPGLHGQRQRLSRDGGARWSAHGAAWPSRLAAAPLSRGGGIINAAWLSCRQQCLPCDGGAQELCRAAFEAGCSAFPEREECMWCRAAFLAGGSSQERAWHAAGKE